MTKQHNTLQYKTLNSFKSNVMQIDVAYVVVGLMVNRTEKVQNSTSQNSIVKNKTLHY